MAKKPSDKSRARNGSRHAEEVSIPARYFLSLKLANARCFADEQTLDLSDSHGRPARWTILLGENGTGKTTVLQVLVALEVRPDTRAESSLPADSWPRALDKSLFYFYSDTLKRHKNREAMLAVIEVGDGPLLSDTETRFDARQRRLRIGPEGIDGDASDCYPTCYAYGAGRRLGSSSLATTEPDDAARSLFYDDSELRNAEEWLLRLDYSASKPSGVQAGQKKRLEQVQELLLRILPDVHGIRFTEPTKRNPTPGIEFETDYGWVPLRQLGYGYRTMIAWMVDFASRMVERYPDSPDPFAEPAVVLIDEIDLHLHPKWQRELIGFLTERFPNTQFIATAHSPLIVQAATGANIALLKREGDHVVIENDMKAIHGWRIDQILTSDLFGLKSARPPELDSLLARRKELLTNPTLTKANQKELEELESKIGSLPTGESFEQAKALELIEKTLGDLKARMDKKS